METGNLIGVALLTVLGTLPLYRLRIPVRLRPLVPVVLSVVIVWVWLHHELLSIGRVLGSGIVSGLLAAGILYILQGLTAK